MLPLWIIVRRRAVILRKRKSRNASADIGYGSLGAERLRETPVPGALAEIRAGRMVVVAGAWFGSNPLNVIDQGKRI
jgi:hypothetical protein